MGAELGPNGAHHALTNESFEWELQVAQSMSRLERPGYWQAFTRGLHRAFYGQAAVGDAEHTGWLSMPPNAGADGADRYQGYRDGLDA